MSARRARQVRVRKARDRERWRRTPLFQQYDEAAKIYFSRVALARQAMHEEQFFRYFHHAPWVELPPGGVKPCRMNGKPARY